MTTSNGRRSCSQSLLLCMGLVTVACRMTTEPLWALVSIAVMSSVHRGVRTTKMAHGEGQYGC